MAGDAITAVPPEKLGRRRVKCQDKKRACNINLVIVNVFELVEWCGS